VDRVFGRRTECLLISSFFRKAIFLCMSFLKTCTTRCWRLLAAGDEECQRDDADKLRLARSTPLLSHQLFIGIVPEHHSVGAESGSLRPFPFAGFETLFSVGVLGAGQATEDLGRKSNLQNDSAPDASDLWIVYHPLTRELTSLFSLSSVKAIATIHYNEVVKSLYQDPVVMLIVKSFQFTYLYIFVLHSTLSREILVDKNGLTDLVMYCINSTGCFAKSK
jgi:hypothetical protein